MARNEVGMKPITKIEYNKSIQTKTKNMLVRPVNSTGKKIKNKIKL